MKASLQVAELRRRASETRAYAERLTLGLDERRNAVATAQALELQADEIEARDRARLASP